MTKRVITEDVPHQCTLTLPYNSQMLEKNIYRPSRCPAGLAPNSAIANQAEYPSHLSVEKYKGLRSIPSGHIIQWQNILLQLAMPIVDFRREETSLIVLQAMYQTGPSNDDKWGEWRSG